MEQTVENSMIVVVVEVAAEHIEVVVVVTAAVVVVENWYIEAVVFVVLESELGAEPELEVGLGSGSDTGPLQAVVVGVVPELEHWL